MLLICGNYKDRICHNVVFEYSSNSKQKDDFQILYPPQPSLENREGQIVQNERIDGNKVNPG